METQRTKKMGYRSKSIIFFTISLLSLSIYTYASSQVKQTAWWYQGNYEKIAYISLIIFFTTLLTSITLFFKYKQNDRYIIYKNVEAKLAIGVTLVVLILLLNLVTGLKFSIIEWVIFGVGIILIVLGIFRKK